MAEANWSVGNARNYSTPFAKTCKLENEINKTVFPEI
jgi:hypothetical protein